ncbi:patatin-like phospholipase family protein [Endothiovibrio diazotrophicus]
MSKRKPSPPPAEEPRAASPGIPQRVLAMDGGGLRSLATLTVLGRLEEAAPGFLNAVELFAGTSAGGINALLLAAGEAPAEALDACLALWDGRVELWHTSPLRSLRAFRGDQCIYDNDRLREALEERLGSRTLGELARGVSVMTFDLTGREGGSWSPVILSNVGVGKIHGEILRAVDAGLATGALPMTLPIAGGYVDGGLYAGNPSMAALSEILCALRGGEQEQPMGHAPALGQRFAALAESSDPGYQGPLSGEQLAGLRLLSVGCGTFPAYLEVLDAHWGWQQWLADAQDPARLVQVAHAGAEQSADLYCQLILGSRGYHRLQPRLSEAVHPSHDFGAAGYAPLIDKVREIALAAGRAVDLEPTLRWLDAGGWG